MTVGRIMLAVVALSSPALAASQTDGITETVVENAMTTWMETRQCRVTDMATERMVSVINYKKHTFVQATQDLREETAREVLRSGIEAYLDLVAYETGQKGTAGCTVNSDMIRVFDFTSRFYSPSTGRLNIDGDEEGKPIFIDGEEKGTIEQTFVLTVGDHVWAVGEDGLGPMDCEEDILIEANKTHEEYCHE